MFAILASSFVAPGCQRWARDIYYPAPTPLFMEEGLREQALDVRQAPEETPSPLGPAGKLNPALIRAVSVTADPQPGGDTKEPDGSSTPPRPPADLPAPAEPQPLGPPSLPGGSSMTPSVGSPYEALPGAAPFPAGVTLAQAIDEALNQSVAVRQELETVVQSQADVRTASLIPNPQLMILSSLLPYPGHPFNPQRQGGPPQYDIWAVWPIDWYLFGKRAREIEAAAREVDVTAAEFADFSRQRVAQTVATFFAVLEAKALLQVARENAANLERVEEHTRKRIEAGFSPTIDLDRARIVLVNSRRDIRTGEATLASAKAQLRALMGREGLDPAFDVAGTLQIARPVPPPPAQAALDIANQWRPDVLAAWRRIEQAQAQVAVEDARRYPAVGLQTGWTYQDQKKAIGFPGEPSWNTGVTMPLPLFDRNQGNRWRSRSELAQAEIALAQRRVEVQSDVEQALAAYEAAYRIVTSEAPQQLEAARSVRNRIEEAYRDGGRTLFELLNAEQTFRDTFRLQINAEVSYWRAIHQLNAAVGQQIVP